MNDLHFIFGFFTNDQGACFTKHEIYGSMSDKDKRLSPKINDIFYTVDRRGNIHACFLNKKQLLHSVKMLLTNHGRDRKK